MIAAFRSRFPNIAATIADCQQRLPFDDHYFDRILAIHVLEHLPNLPAAIAELHRVCNKQHGLLSVVIPCEGGFAYGLARRVSAQRVFENRYKQPYRWFIEREHINKPNEIVEELQRYFHVRQSDYWPLMIPVTSVNLCIGLTLAPS
jgi:ubiquinone/menaquinone biosynthesis C-methylase UbiE